MGGEEVLGSIINKYLKDSDIGKKLRSYSIFNHWKDIVGEKISSKTKPEKLFRGILYISVSS